MSARILIAGDQKCGGVQTRTVSLSGAYFVVNMADHPADVRRIAPQGGCDLIVVDQLGENFDAEELCQQLRDDEQCAHIPVLVIAEEGDSRAPGRFFDAGADDVIDSEMPEGFLVTRLRNLARAKTAFDEMRMRVECIQATITETGDPGEIPEAETSQISSEKPKILLVNDDSKEVEFVRSGLSGHFDIEVEIKPSNAFVRAADGGYELVLLSLSLDSDDGLRICSLIRTAERSRQIPILTMGNRENLSLVERGLDLGADDYIFRPLDLTELISRISIRLRRKRVIDRFRAILDDSVRLALTDPLTGLYNRRYLDEHLARHILEARSLERPLSVMILDVDHFKRINDQHGHDVGDAVLREVGARLHESIRKSDFACRYGGEEFVLVMPNTKVQHAMVIGERLRRAIGNGPVELRLDTGKPVSVTVSIGLSTFEEMDESSDILLRRADRALYNAKKEGRNRVVADAA